MARLLNKNKDEIGHLRGDVVYDTEFNEVGRFEHASLFDKDGKRLGHTSYEWIYHADDRETYFDSAIAYVDTKEKAYRVYKNHTDELLGTIMSNNYLERDKGGAAIVLLLEPLPWPPQ